MKNKSYVKNKIQGYNKSDELTALFCFHIEALNIEFFKDIIVLLVHQIPSVIGEFIGHQNLLPYLNGKRMVAYGSR